MRFFDFMRAGVVSLILLLSLSALADNCGRVSGQRYWTCRAIAQKNCGLASADTDGFLLCRGVTQNNCAAAGSSALTCQAILTKNCSMAMGEDYWLCVALTR